MSLLSPSPQQQRQQKKQKLQQQMVDFNDSNDEVEFLYTNPPPSLKKDNAYEQTRDKKLAAESHSPSLDFAENRAATAVTPSTIPSTPLS